MIAVMDKSRILADQSDREIWSDQLNNGNGKRCYVIWRQRIGNRNSYGVMINVSM